MDFLCMDHSSRVQLDSFAFYWKIETLEGPPVCQGD